MNTFKVFFEIGSAVGISVFLFCILPALLVYKKIKR